MPSPQWTDHRLVPFFFMSEEKNDFGASKEGPYGCGGGVFGAKRLQWLNTVGWLTFFMFTFCTIYGFNINGALLATITTMEKRFEFSSTISGIILSSYDIGFLVACIPLETLARRSSRGGVLGRVRQAFLFLECFSFDFFSRKRKEK